MKKFLIYPLTLIFSGSVSAFTELKGSPEELKKYLKPDVSTVRIVGSAEESAYADIANANLIVKTESKSFSNAIGLNVRLREKIVSAFVQAGVDPNDIKTSKFSTSPQYGWFGKEPSSYEVINRMSISVTSEKLLQEIAKAADQYQEVTFSSTTFEHSEKEHFEELVLSAAIDDALTQKKYYEKKLGLKLKPVDFQHGSVVQDPTEGSLMLEEVVVTAQRMPAKYSSSARVREVVPTFDEVGYEADVTVIFEIVEQ
ncbi:SIMPL domain-containing protein [Microbulbifer sp. GL-2]|uniref:SIMPL domain-containing protein n=1 Tax=Microbulbifer sp. GL-2 TaxID=2591606 RepID=UPI0011631F34|nr:SIMPL domain-containing protein [Microbulbifer sp. GL-2]BBM00130.1 hypothetical protein GL2_02040 [Microbulbifer sp. GL-2]